MPVSQAHSQRSKKEKTVGAARGSVPEVSAKGKLNFEIDPVQLLLGEPKNAKSAANQTPFQKR